MSACDSLPPLAIVGASDKHSSTSESLPPPSCASLAYELARESDIWESSSVEDDPDATSFALSLIGDEETRASTKTSTLDEGSTHSFGIQPPVVAKRKGRRPWVGISSSSKQAADGVGSPSHSIAAKLLSEEENPKMTAVTTDTSLAHDLDGKNSVAATRCQAWAPDGSARPIATSAMRSRRRVNEERTLALEPCLRGADVRVEIEEIHDEMLSQFSGVSARPRSAAKTRAQSDRRQRKVNTRRFASDSDRTSLESNESIQKCGEQRCLTANACDFLPSRPRLIVQSPHRRASSNVVYHEQAVTSKRSESASRLKVDNVRSEPGPPSPRVVVLSKEDPKGSGVKYDCLQFIATPSLSTSCDKSNALTPRAQKAKSATIAKAAQHKRVLDELSSKDDVLRRFRGRSKRDVKDMVHGAYSAEEVAEVFQILSVKEREEP